MISDDLIDSFASAQNWVLQPLAIPAICMLRSVGCVGVTLWVIADQGLPEVSIRDEKQLNTL